MCKKKIVAQVESISESIKKTNFTTNTSVIEGLFKIILLMRIKLNSTFAISKQWGS